MLLVFICLPQYLDVHTSKNYTLDFGTQTSQMGKKYGQDV